VYRYSGLVYANKIITKKLFLNSEIAVETAVETAETAVETAETARHLLCACMRVYVRSIYCNLLSISYLEPF